MIENFETPLLMFVPAYYFIKGVLCLWLYSPETQGANLIRQVVSKLVLKPAKEKEKEPPKTEPKNEEKRGIIRASSARWGMRA